MNRTLRRPMFRKGGTPNEGIMSGLKEPRQGYNMGGGIGSMVRQNYAEGDSVIPANTQEYRDYLKQELYPKNTLIGDTNRLLGNVNDFLFNTTVRPIGNLGNYIVGRKEGLNTIKKRDYEDTMINRILRAKGIDPDAEIEETPPDEPELEGGPGPEGGPEPEKELQEADLKTVYADLLPMFKEALGTDDDELNRQKYLELARFGTNLLAQPGGDLTGAVGKAAAPSIEGLAKIADAQRQAAKLPAKYALEAALKEVEPGQIAKSVKDLESLGYSRKEALRKIVDEGSGTSTRQQTLSREIDRDAAALLDSPLGIKDSFTARKLAKQLFQEGIGIQEVDKLPEDKDDYIEGGIYIHKGKIKKYKKGNLYTRGEKGFK